MAETGKTGRLLPYVKVDYSEKISVFKKAIEEQLDVLEIAISEVEPINDIKIADKFVKKTRRFLETPFFTDPSYASKKVQDLKIELKVKTRGYKAVSSILDERILSKRSNKILLARRYALLNGGYGDFYYPYEYQDFFRKDIEYLRGELPKYESKLILMNRLKGILADKGFLKNTLKCKNSWKVATLKKELSSWVQDHSLEAEFELEEIFTLCFFKRKHYLDMDINEIREAVDVECRALTNIIDWLKSEIMQELNLIKQSEEDNSKIANNNVYDIYKVYDSYIDKWTSIKKTMNSTYSLYRFGQGLIEADIFDSLYK